MHIWYYIKNTIINYIIAPVVYQNTKKLKIMNSLESINYIINNKCSISRFGDGELKIIWGEKNGFQDTNNELGNRLKRILLSSPIDNHIIGIPYTLKDYSNLANPFEFWPAFTTVNYRKLKKLLNFNYQYADSLMSRFYIDYLDIDKAKIQINLLKRIWDNKDLLIIEGVYSRTGVGNDLYDNAKSIRRILGPARNAFDSYER